MIKSVRIIGESYISIIKRQPCAAHTLQLSVHEGLKQCKNVHRRIKSLQSFFWHPKQAQRLREAQITINEIDESIKTSTSPLDVLTDVKTWWNSTYIVWKRLLKLHNAIRFVSTSLLMKSDRISQKEGEKLEQLILTIEEKK